MAALHLTAGVSRCPCSSGAIGGNERRPARRARLSGLRARGGQGFAVAEQQLELPPGWLAGGREALGGAQENGHANGAEAAAGDARLQVADEGEALVITGPGVRVQVQGALLAPAPHTWRSQSWERRAGRASGELGGPWRHGMSALLHCWCSCWRWEGRGRSTQQRPRW